VIRIVFRPIDAQSTLEEPSEPFSSEDPQN
jgi:hypothetical protein